MADVTLDAHGAVPAGTQDRTASAAAKDGAQDWLTAIEKSSLTPRYYATIVREKSILRSLIHAGSQITQHAFEGESSLSARVKQAGVHFRWLSENVCEGPTPGFIHAQFMKSPAHRANVLDRDMDSIGIGVADHDGQLYAVEDFSQAR